jgi:Ca2+-binding EF-hand superfamily protein
MKRVLFPSLAILAFFLAGFANAQDDKKPDTNAVKGPQRRSSDVVFILIETSGFDESSVAELQRLYDVLRKLDKNNDGKIDPEALKAARMQIVEDRVDHIMTSLDTDKDGKISRDEAKGRILENFDRLDQNGDGFISREELRQAIMAAPKAKKSEDPK